LIILLAEDDLVACKLISAMIERLGYARPDIANNGLDAINAALARSHDLLLVNPDLPELDVAQTARELKFRLGQNAPYIVAMLGREESGCGRQRCLDAGFDEVVDEPLRRRQLVEVLTKAARSKAEAQTQDFNRAIWNEMLDVFGCSGVVRIAEALARDVSAQVQRHDAAIAAGDLPALKQIAHALRGASLQLGAEALAELCGATETACTAKDATAALRLSTNALARYRILIEHLVQQAKMGRI